MLPDSRPFLERIKQTLIAPERAVAEIAPSASYADGLIVVVGASAFRMLAGTLAGMLGAIFFGILLTIFYAIITAGVGFWMGLLMGAMMFLLSACIPFVWLFALPFIVAGSFINAGIVWFVGKQLGGTADFERFYGCFVYPVSAFDMVAAVFAAVSTFLKGASTFGSILAFIFELVVSPFLFGLWIAALWYQTIFVRELHRISTGRAVIAVLSPLLLLIGICVMFVFALFALVLVLVLLFKK